MFQRMTGDWTKFRSRLNLSSDDEIDLHFGPRDPSVPYCVAMSEVAERVENSLKNAQAQGRPYVMVIHGWSTSRPGKRTARSIVRNFMRSKEATSLIERKHCIQHGTVFVAKIRPL